MIVIFDVNLPIPTKESRDWTSGDVTEVLSF